MVPSWSLVVHVARGPVPRGSSARIHPAPFVSIPVLLSTAGPVPRNSPASLTAINVMHVAGARTGPISRCPWEEDVRGEASRNAGGACRNAGLVFLPAPPHLRGPRQILARTARRRT